jgi:hypothetical protein
LGRINAVVERELDHLDDRVSIEHEQQTHWTARRPLRGALFPRDVGIACARHDLAS